jgi:hypothetical protein
VDGFVHATLTPAEWTHDAHLAVGTWQVAQLGHEAAFEQLQRLIPRLNLALGNVNDDHHGYHDTITRAYVVLIADLVEAERRRASTPPSHESLVHAVLAHPLARKDALLRFYSRDRLMSVDARRGWGEPDLCALGLPVLES